MALIMTKSPIVLVPSLILVAHSTMTIASPMVKMTAWPALSTASET